MKKQFLSGVSFIALAVATPAIGADMPMKAPVYKAPVEAVYNWTGWYVGANAGALWGESDVTSSAPCTATSGPPGYFCTTTNGVANGAAVGAAGTGSLSGSGFTGGVQAGYNWQNGQTVVGLEADFNAFHFRGSQTVSANYPVSGPNVGTGNVFTVGTSADADWLFTARGRIGWLVDPKILAYATGGLAVTQLKVANSFSDNYVPAATGGSSNSATKLGWVLGGGLEWAFDKHWSAKAEYLYVNFNSVTVNSIITSTRSGGGYAQAINTSADLTAQIARVGINYKF
jgi:outer membrane immunogenic protein